MPRPKKAEKQKKEEVVLDLRQDREEFLRAFEKPTQIYRFLRARHCISPVFLHRTLLYMLDRCSRNNARRKSFHVDNMLCKAQFLHSVQNNQHTPQRDQLKIVVSGFYIDPGVNHENSFGKKLSDIDVEVLLRKVYRCRRKDGESLQSEQQLGIAEAAVNPRSPDSYVTEPVYLHTTNLFQSAQGQTVKNYLLVFRVFEPSDDSSETSSESSEDMRSDDESGEGRKRKGKDDPGAVSLKNLTSGTRRRATAYEEDDNSEIDVESSGAVTEPPRKMKKLSKDRFTARTAIYEAELEVFTSDKETVLVDGEYELSFTRKHTRASDGRKNATWEALDGGREIKVLSTMTSTPVLKFNLTWSVCDKPGPLAVVGSESKASSDETDAKRARRRTSLKTDDETSASTAERNELPAPPKLAVDSVCYRKSNRNSSKSLDGSECQDATTPVVFYQFIYNNESQQQTEARNDLHCPWCLLNCTTLYGLIKHLKMTHPRFHFTYTAQNQGCCIEVSVNECYDGSYCGNPQFVYSQPGMAFSRRGPVRRTPVTDTLFYRSDKERHLTKMDPNELLEKEENEAPPASHYAAGHHRLYFHSDTNVPIRPCEFDVDSEEEPDPDWLKDHIRKMLDEFTDVNDGEKRIMKLWNLYVMKNRCIADGQMADCCRAFLDLYGPTIHRLNLRRNLLLHLVNLVDFGVLKTSVILSLMQHFDQIGTQEAKPELNSRPRFLFSHSSNNSGVHLFNGNHSRVGESTPVSDKSRLEQLRKIVEAADVETTV